MYIWGAPELLPVASVAHVVAVALPWACSPVWFYLLGSSIFPLRMNRSSISRFNLIAFSWAQLPNSTFCGAKRMLWPVQLPCSPLPCGANAHEADFTVAFSVASDLPCGVLIAHGR